MTIVVSCGDFDQKLWVNDVPLHAFGRIEQYWDGVMGNPELYGNSLRVPLRPGEVFVPKTTGARTFIVGMLTYGQDQGEHNDAWRDLARMVWSPRQVLNVKRVVKHSTGDETHECSAEYVSGLDANMLAGGRMGKMAIRFKNLDGYWYGLSNETYTVSNGSTINVPGDAPTRRMTLEFSGGSGSQVLTNTTTGAAVSWPDSTGVPVTLDVLAFTTDVGVGPDGGDLGVGKIRHAGDPHWMVLAPGDNEFTLTGGGSVEINARTAHL